jgi:hypothetical protein
MQRLDPVQFTQFIQSISKAQAEIVTLLRNTVLTEDPQVRERIEEGKWLHGYLKYDSPHGTFVYAIGAKANGKVSFHTMTFYGSPILQQHYGALLTPFLSGKSCFDFTSAQDIPLGVIQSLVHNGSQYIDESVPRTRR